LTSSTTSLSGEFTVAPEHPALAGHFPGNPVVPGVLILAHVLAGVRPRWPVQEPLMVRQVKFSSPLRPGESCRIDYRSGRARELRFECHAGDRLIASGQLGPESP